MRDIKIGLIGGSGLGQALASEQGETHSLDTPFGSPSSDIVVADIGGTSVAILQRHGEGHTLNPSAVPYRANIHALKQLGVTHIVASGATGSLREDIRPRDLVIADQVIDKTRKRANTFYEHAAVHVEFAEPFCPVMRRWLLDAAAAMGCVLPPPPSGKGRGGGAPDNEAAAAIASTPSQSPPMGETAITVHDGGTYVCMEGPAFSTRAESHMHRGWGGDLIGMTCMPEAKLAREAEIAYALVALPTDYDCWRPHEPGQTPQQLLEEIIGHLQAATANSIALIKQALGDVSALRDNPSPAHNALALAIWSDKSKLDPAEVKRLETLWGRYFE